MCIGGNLPYFYGLNNVCMACIDHYPRAGGKVGGLSGGRGQGHRGQVEGAGVSDHLVVR